jgi:hypothetical protein
VCEVDHPDIDSYTDMDDDQFTFGDPLTINGPDFDRFRKLAAQLGGLSIDIWAYEERFGAITDASPFGERVWHGLSELACTYPHHCTINGAVAWLGKFIGPVLLSTSTAASTLSATTPSTASLTQLACPAIFVLDRQQHACLTDTVISPHRIGRNPSDLDFYDGLELRGRMVLTEAETMSDPWSIASWTTIEFDSLAFGSVQVLCLETLLAGSRPWYVHANQLLLYKPLSRL